MTIFEDLLTGKLEIKEFIRLLKEDSGVQDQVRDLIPEETKGNPEHPFYKITHINYIELEKVGFDYWKYMMRVPADLNGRFGGNYDIFNYIERAYAYHNPHIKCTDKYYILSTLYIAAVSDCYEGEEVRGVLENIIMKATELYDTKGKQVNYIKQEIKKTFHVILNSRPYWIQSGEWPMGKNSPMKYLRRKKISEGCEYLFEDVDTGEQRKVTQYY